MLLINPTLACYIKVRIYRYKNKQVDTKHLRVVFGVTNDLESRMEEGTNG